MGGTERSHGCSSGPAAAPASRAAGPAARVPGRPERRLVRPDPGHVFVCNRARQLISSYGSKIVLSVLPGSFKGGPDPDNNTASTRFEFGYRK